MTETPEKPPSKLDKVAELLEKGKETLLNPPQIPIEKLEAIPPRLLNVVSRKPRLVIVKGLGRTKRRKYTVEGNTLILKSFGGRGKKLETATFTVGSIITLGVWPLKRSFMFLREGASRCVDFQTDLVAPQMTIKEVRQAAKFVLGKNMFAGISAAMKKPESILLYLMLLMLAFLIAVNLGWVG